jgi:hypothetical protein
MKRLFALFVVLCLALALPASAAEKKSKKPAKDKTMSEAEYQTKLKEKLDRPIPAVFDDVTLSEVCKRLKADSRFEDVTVGAGVDEGTKIKMDTLQMSARNVFAWVAELSGEKVKAVIVDDWKVVFQVVEDPKDAKWAGQIIEKVEEPKPIAPKAPKEAPKAEKPKAGEKVRDNVATDETSKKVAAHKITLTVKDMSLEDAAVQLRMKNVNVVLIKPDRNGPKVSVDVKGEAVPEVLDKLLVGSGYKWRIADGAVVIERE